MPVNYSSVVWTVSRLLSLLSPGKETADTSDYLPVASLFFSSLLPPPVSHNFLIRDNWGWVRCPFCLGFFCWREFEVPNNGKNVNAWNGNKRANLSASRSPPEFFAIWLQLINSHVSFFNFSEWTCINDKTHRPAKRGNRGNIRISFKRHLVVYCV